MPLAQTGMMGEVLLGRAGVAGSSRIGQAALWSARSIAHRTRNRSMRGCYYMNMKSRLCVLSLAVPSLLAACTEHVPAGTPDEKQATTLANSPAYDWKPFVPDSALDGYLLGRDRVFWDEDLRNSDFSGKNLLGYTLCDVDLRGAKFDGADLRHAVFCDYTKLQGASFRGADLRRARFVDCEVLGPQNDLTDALINDAWTSDQNAGSTIPLTEQQLRSTKSFKDRNLNGCNISIPGSPALDLRHFDLRRMTVRMDFTNCRLEGADLTGTTFLRDSKISQEQLESTCRWPGHDFVWSASRLTLHCPIQGVKKLPRRLDNLSFNPQGADLTNTCIRGVTFLGGTLTKQQLYSTSSYKRRDLRNVTFKGLQNDWDFSGQDLTGARFLGFRSNLVTSLPQADVTDAIVTDIGLELTLEQFKSTWNYRNGYLRGVYLEQYRDEWEKELREKSAAEGAEEEACSPVSH